MLGLFGIFGRSTELRRLDGALRGVGLHPRAVPEAVKLTALNLLGEAHGASPDPRAVAAAAALLGYCMLGPRGFTEANGPGPTAAAEERLEAALAAGDGLDARLVLLALYAGVIQPALVERYGLEAGRGGPRLAPSDTTRPRLEAASPPQRRPCKLTQPSPPPPVGPLHGCPRATPPQLRSPPPRLRAPDCDRQRLRLAR